MFSENYEDFTESQLKTLERYVTNSNSHIFALHNLPEVIKGALFSRYSRSSLGLRTLLLKEFVTNNDEAQFELIAGDSANDSPKDPAEQVAAIKKAQNFYDRILDGYGDDSIGELGGTHLAIENVSMIAAKVIEDSRIGGSPLEKSTRYIYFDQKVKGEYLFYREPVLMTSAFRSLYIDTCNMLFETYGKLIPPMTALMEERFPKESEVSKVAYSAAVRAKVLDCLRGLLPAGTLTNMGVYGNGRFYEQLIRRLHGSNLAELQEIGKNSFDELSKVIPSFVRRSDLEHRHYQSTARFHEEMQGDLKALAEQYTVIAEQSVEPGVRLVNYDPESAIKVCAALLYPYCNKGMHELIEVCRHLPEEELNRLLDAASGHRENRRHKSPRALEHAQFTFEIIADFGAYRDLQRHRILTQQRQSLSCQYGYYIPQEILGTSMENDYLIAMQKAKSAYDIIASEFPEEAQYVVPMAYNIRWYFHINLRSLQWVCELRSAPQGHPNYRFVAQHMAKEVCRVFPEFERFFKFVDYEGYRLGRLDQEQRKATKLFI